MNPVFGVHVGNSSACLSICKHEESKECTKVLANHTGDRVMPAIVTVLDGEIVVGTACKSLMISQYKSTVIFNKTILDRNIPCEYNNVKRATMVVKDGRLFYELPSQNGLEYKTPFEIASCIYHTLYCIAKEVMRGEDNNVSCVLTVPEHFSYAARLKVQSAAEEAGWDVLQVIHEPAAVVLGYNILSEHTLPPNQKILVYRVGGHSSDVCLIDLNYGMMSILDSEHSEEVGGKLLVSALTIYLADEFNKKYKIDPKENYRSWAKLTQAAENCLNVLSTIESAKCFIESLCEGIDFDYTISRARFESLLFPLLNTFTTPLYSLFSRLNISPDKIAMVLLCGGLMKIPKLKKNISDIFPETYTKVIAIPNGINYDEVLACGAARQAGYIASYKFRGAFLSTNIDVPTLEFPLTFQVVGGQSECLGFEAGQPLPIHQCFRVSSPADKVKITLEQVNGSQLIMEGEIELESLEDSTDLVLEIDKECVIKVKKSGGTEEYAPQ